MSDEAAGMRPDEAYTRKSMETARLASSPDTSRFDGLHADAERAVEAAAVGLRAVRERYREAYLDELAQWHALRDELDRRVGAPDETGLAELQQTVERATTLVGQHQQDLSRLDLANQALERTSRFLQRGDGSLLTDPAEPGLSTDVRMRIVEAQEAERSRLAQEVHDGPAQALTNAIFQVEYLERVMGQDGRLAEAELRFLRELLRRELGEVRSFISNLRPPLLDHLGLDEAIEDTATSVADLTGLTIETDLQAPGDRLDGSARTVALRVVQEALQNVRKHAAATHVDVRTRLVDGDWTLEVVDDGLGFDPTSVTLASGRHFGLRFMRERAELIGARLDVRSGSGGGTVVRLAVPLGGERR
jgi:signal transduction histidine kinase